MIRTIALIALLALLIPFAPVDAKSKTNVTCQVTAEKKLVQASEKVMISWTASHAFLGYGPDGARVPAIGSMLVEPAKTTIYKFKFVGIGGSEKCGVRIRVKGQVVPE